LVSLHKQPGAYPPRKLEQGARRIEMQEGAGAAMAKGAAAEHPRYVA